MALSGRSGGWAFGPLGGWFVIGWVVTCLPLENGELNLKLRSVVVVRKRRNVLGPKGQGSKKMSKQVEVKLASGFAFVV